MTNARLTARLALFDDLIDVEMQPKIPRATEEYPVEFEYIEAPDVPILDSPRGKAWENKYTNIGKR